MSSNLAVRIENVSKKYPLYADEREQLLDVLTPKFMSRKRRSARPMFTALDGVSLDIAQGKRIALIGKNGAGKTTLLKILLGVSEPTEGRVVTRGKIQALMSTGIGFHPDYTGEENAKSALEFTDLSKRDYAAALHDIEDFCELGEFWTQPFRTYSLGMQARLMFAAATAIKPELLIVDEVLGAGDSYFVEKSRLRVQKLVSNGLTLILVSHSMQQVLELCSEAVWLDKGRIRMQGEAFEVVKAYEEHMHNSATRLADSEPSKDEYDVTPDGPDTGITWEFALAYGSEVARGVMQEPNFLPNSRVWRVRRRLPSRGFHNVAPGGVSKWDASAPGPKLVGFQIETPDGPTGLVRELQPIQFRLVVESSLPGWFEVRYGLVITDELGRTVARFLSPVESLAWGDGEVRDICLVLDPIQLGAGTYDVGVSLMGGTQIENMNAAARYDLASRSFRFTVESPDSSPFRDCKFIHSGEWRMGT